MGTTTKELFARHVGSATARQLALGDLLGERPWALDIRSGLATFSDLIFPVQLLGTESEGDNSWLWAWANEASALPESILRSSLRLKTIGMERHLTMLTSPLLPLNDFSGHQIAMISTGLLGGGPYYRGPYEGGAVYFTLEGVTLPNVDGARISTVLMQVISSFEVDHRLATRSFLGDLGFRITESKSQLLAVDSSGTQIQTDFDSNDLLAGLEVSLSGARARSV
jgi:hypothetical protein